MATTNLTFSADTFAGTAESDEILIGSLGRLAGHDTLDAGAGLDTLRWVTTNPAFDGSYLAGSQGWDRLDFTSGTTSLTVKLNAWSVQQSDTDVLTVVIGANTVDLDTSLVQGAGTVLVQGTGLVILRNTAGQKITLADGHNGNVRGGASADSVQGGSGSDRLEGGLERDELKGGAGQDTLIGGEGADILTGGAGGDSLDGGLEGDVLVVGAGDTVRGGDGVDFFQVLKGAGTLTILDRAAGEKIDLRAFADTTARSSLVITDTADGAAIEVGTTKVILAGVTAASLADSDFMFANTNSNVIAVAAGTATSVLQGIIDTAPAGAVIELAAGVFTITQTLLIDRDDITLRGAGSNLTTLVNAIPGGSAGPVIDVVGGGRQFLANVSTTAAAGSTTLTLGSVAGISVGDVIYVMQLNDDAFLAATGNTGVQFPADYASNPDRYALREMLVEVVGIAGKTLTLSHALPFTFEAGKAAVSSTNMLENVEVSGFSIDTNLGEPDPFAFTNTLASWGPVPMVGFDNVMNSRISDVVINDAPSRGFEFRRTFQVTGENLSVNGAHNKGDGGNGYGVTLNEAFANTLTGLSIFDVRHAVLFSDMSAEHFNVVQVAETNRDINFHGSPDADNTVVVDWMEQDYPIGSSPQWAAVGPGIFPIHPRSTIEDNSVTFRFLRASQEDDRVVAHAQGGDLAGRGGNDTLIGGAAVDTLSGGGDNDMLTGGGGSDRFLRTFGDKLDTITDFKTGSGGDVIVLRGYAFQAFGDLRLTQSGADTLVDLGQDGRMILQNVQKTALTAANFQFVKLNTGQTVLADGSAAFVLGSDGADVMTMGNSQITGAKPALGGTGVDRVVLQVGNFSSDTANWGPWSGIEILDLSSATSVALVVSEGFLTQSDNDRVVLRFGPTTAVTVNVGDYAVGDLVLEGSATVALANSRSQSVRVSDAVAGKVNGGSSADTIIGGALGDTLTGGGGNDRLEGGAGKDVLDGGVGLDTLAGGGGDDVYLVEAASDSIVEQAKGGVDEVRTALASYTLGAQIEDLTGTSASGQTLTGNGLKNEITGGAAADVLFGLGGSDKLFGGAGNDRLEGGAGSNTLDGGAGLDTLVGGSGKDRMIGGADADRFVFTSLGDSDVAQKGRDVIVDLGSGDRIDLTAIDAIAGTAANDAFVIVPDFTSVAGQLVIDFLGDRTMVMGDVNGDAVADFAIEVLGAGGVGAHVLIV
jgi:Ca2+-binding RTX toxin-like protein